MSFPVFGVQSPENSPSIRKGQRTIPGQKTTDAISAESGVGIRLFQHTVFRTNLFTIYTARRDGKLFAYNEN
jgi:hypothetical protein